MNTELKLIGISLITAVSLSLTACGGGANGTTADSEFNDDTSNIDTTHPEFLPVLARASVAYEPVGEIQVSQPTFIWNPTAGATNYMFGHEDVESEMRWHSYTVSAQQAGCEAGVAGANCSYQPTDISFAVGDKKVWWVRAETPSGWEEWSNPHVFKVTDGVSLPHAKPISPKGIVDTLTPTFTWSISGNGATDYQIGMESEDASDWVTYTVPAAQANCQSSQCSYKPSKALVHKDKKTWWVREHVSSRWQDWSEGLTFTVDSNPVYVPFANTPNVTGMVEVDGKWFAFSAAGTEVLKDDGAANVTTIVKTKYGFASPLSTAIPGKLFFVVVSKRASTTPGNGYGYGRHEELHSYDIATNKDFVIISESDVVIENGTMTDYLLVNKRHRSYGRGDMSNARKYYKIDLNSEMIYLGMSRHISGNSFTVLSADSTKNEIHVKIREIINNTRVESFKKITSTADVGLEDETPYVPFENTANVTGIVEVDGKWYAKNSTGKQILKDDGASNITTVFTTEGIVNTSLSAAISGKIFFVVRHNFGSGGYGTGHSDKLYSFDIASELSTVFFAESDIVIVNGTMTDYILVNKRHHSNGAGNIGNPRNYYKIDLNSESIYLGKTQFGDSFSVASVDETNNEIHVVIRKIVNATPVLTYKKITGTAGVGLEDE